MKKVLVANRGEIACRIIRSCQALDLRTVAVYSDADAGSWHVGAADEAFALGGNSALESYLKIDRILEVVRESKADAVHPGYGFLAENDTFARAVEAADVTWVGPTPESIVEMGDKVRARAIARAAGVPVLLGSARFVPGENEGVLQAGHAVGFPLLVKATAGGGGIGMRRVDSADSLGEAVEATQSMALRAFGDGTVYLERYIARARHVEVQVFGTGDGQAWHAFERDCSIQRRFQKVVEESPAPGLPEAVRERMLEAAVALCRQQRYRGAGTVEFVLDADSFEFFFLEMNTRIQVEHPVTEMTTGLDLVAMQLQLAGKFPLPVHSQADIRSTGHAIECRLYAERPAKGFLPSTGTMRRFQLPKNDSTVRVDCGFREGDKVTHFYDPLLAKIIARGPDRTSAIGRLRDALDEISIEGVETNLDFLRRTVSHPLFRQGQVWTGFVDANKADLIA